MARRKDLDDDEDDELPRRRRRDEDEDDEEEDRPRGRRPADDDEEDDEEPPRRKPGGKGQKKSGGLVKVVPYKNKPALIGYYCAVFALIPGLNFILGPVALILGVVGLFRKKKNTEAHGTGHALFAIIVGILAPPLWIFLWFLVFEGMTKPQG